MTDDVNSKQKVKCVIENDELPCARCTQRGLSCVLNRSLQSILDDTRNIQALQDDVFHLHGILTKVCKNIKLLPPPPLSAPHAERSRAPRETCDDSTDDSEQDRDISDDSPSMSLFDLKGPVDAFLDPTKSTADSPALAAMGAAHASTISNQDAAGLDIISKGIISLAVADDLVARYRQKLDHYLYGIGNLFSDLESLRRLSPVLLASVCTVSALHEGTNFETYLACKEEFLNLVSQSIFETRGVEFLRALCIGCYWLSDVSRILSSDALRRSADVHLRKYFYLVTVQDFMSSQVREQIAPAEMVDRVRLWYLFYVSDQHLSILYNLDPIVNADQDIIFGWEAFLESSYTNFFDVQIVSQVALLQIVSQIRSSIGPESNEPLSRALVTTLNNFNRQIEQWFMRFTESFSKYLPPEQSFDCCLTECTEAIHEKIGDLPRRGLTFHYHFAKLYLGQYVFRGLKSEAIPVHFRPAALMAHGAATLIFECLLNDASLPASLSGVPFYIHVMISFAGHFLLSCGQHWEQMSIDFTETLNLMHKSIGLFKTIQCIEQHPIREMTIALENKYQECRATINRSNTPQYRYNSEVPITGSRQGSYPWDFDSAISRGNDGQAIQINNNIIQQSIPGLNVYRIGQNHGDTNFDINFQDLDGFDFPELQFPNQGTPFAKHQ